MFWNNLACFKRKFENVFQLLDKTQYRVIMLYLVKFSPMIYKIAIVKCIFKIVCICFSNNFETYPAGYLNKLQT